MIHANDNVRSKSAQVPEVPEENLLQEEHENWFHLLTKQEKRFHILFYALAGLTGILVIQLVWQIAVLTTAQ